jgi:enamine deaminase RidA (YjgF/YER057c/UK114 family)
MTVAKLVARAAIADAPLSKASARETLAFLPYESHRPQAISRALHSAPHRGHHMTIQRIETGARMTKVVIHGDTVYLAGFTAKEALAGGVAEQTTEILSIIDGYLAKAGTDKTKLLRATIWLSDIRTVDDMNRVWDAWVPAGCAPARACIEALLQGPEKKVEIQVTAAK